MLDPVLPIAFYLLFGYLFKVYFKDNSKELIEFIIYFSLPAIVFNKIYQLELSFEIFKLIIMFNIIILLNLVLAYFFAKFLKLEKKLFATFLIVATFGNTSFIGFSYIDAFYGQDYVVYALIYDLFGSFLLLVSLGMIIINWGSGQYVNFKSITKSVLYFPPIIMFFITIFAKFFTVPTFIINTTETLGATLVPLAMVAIGMKLQIKNIFYKLKEVISAMFLKMFIVPILVYFAFLFFYNIEDTWSKVTIIEAAMPPMTMAVVLAIKGGLDETFAINALVLGVLSSLLTVTGFYYFLM
ncbi:AEC family transporter [Malaciobacter mytili]|uniref:Transporter n=1 Tax=Malaciobacter mytili LMG 24559 TaxID=1032238 RepID=A0AAX2AGS7_9BACT|nr:AEC family transporter [Malaciobacter mytili]AXH15610.1 putative permease [Malaciobacter mytili LMG 24559]RXK16202.1 transporter [Malaciobacter mytili LMG 24559]